MNPRAYAGPGNPSPVLVLERAQILRANLRPLRGGLDVDPLPVAGVFEDRPDLERVVASELVAP